MAMTTQVAEIGERLRDRLRPSSDRATSGTPSRSSSSTRCRCPSGTTAWSSAWIAEGQPAVMGINAARRRTTSCSSAVCGRRRCWRCGRRRPGRRWPWRPAARSSGRSSMQAVGGGQSGMTVHDVGRVPPQGASAGGPVLVIRDCGMRPPRGRVASAPWQSVLTLLPYLSPVAPRLMRGRPGWWACSGCRRTRRARSAGSSGCRAASTVAADAGRRRDAVVHRPRPAVRDDAGRRRTPRPDCWERHAGWTDGRRPPAPRGTRAHPGNCSANHRRCTGNSGIVGRRPLRARHVFGVRPRQLSRAVGPA